MRKQNQSEIKVPKGFKLKSDMEDYSNQPFFQKKLEKANQFLRTVKLPEELLPSKTTA